MRPNLALLCLPVVLLASCSGDDEVAESGDSAVAEAAIDSTTPIDTSTPDSSIDSAVDSETGAPDSFDSGVDAGDTGTFDSFDSDVDADSGAPDISDADGETPADIGADAPPPAEALWVVRIGDGVFHEDGAAVKVAIDRLKLSDGTLLGTIELPTTGTDAGTAHGLALSIDNMEEGKLHVSSDGHFATLAGYDVALGSAASGGADLRVVARIDSAGVVDTTTTFTEYANRNVCAAVSADGTGYWVGGFGGTTPLRYVAHGASASASVGPVRVRDLTVFDDTLFGASSGTPRIFSLSGLPKTSTTATMVDGTASASPPHGIAFVSRGGSGADTMYVCTDSNLQRWTKSGPTWSLGPTFEIALGADAGETTGCLGVTAKVSGSTVRVFVVSLEAPTSRIVSLTDFDTTPGTFATFATAPTLQAFRGVAYAPTP